MQALFQSSFLQALGYAIANSLWQAALLWLGALLISTCFRLSAHNRYRVAITAQAASFIWFSITLRFYYVQCTRALAEAQVLLQQNTIFYNAVAADDQYSMLAYISKAEALLPYLSLAYLCLLCVLAVRWFKIYRYTHQLKNQGLQKAGMDLRLFVGNMAAQLGIKQDVKIYLSNLVTSPLTIGFLKPLILVPVATINHLTTQQLEAVLLHELAHIRRADYLVNLLLNIIETILFFNPFTRLLSRTIQKEREHCCDDWVLQFRYNASMYAEALLRIACLQAAPVMAMKAEGQHKGELFWRIKRLLNQQQKSFSYSQQMLVLAVTTVMLISVAWLQPSGYTKQKQAAAVAKPAKSVVVAPMTAEVANPLFNPLAFLAKPLKEEIQKATAEIAQQHLDKVVISSLDAAGQALTAVKPEVTEAIKKMSTDENIKKAQQDVQKALTAIKWSELKQLAPFADSVFLTNSVKLAFSKNQLLTNLLSAQQHLAGVQQQIDKLKQEDFALYLNQDYLTNNINGAINQLNIEKIFQDWDNASKRQPKIPADKKKALKSQPEILLRKLMDARKAPQPARAYTIPAPDEAPVFAMDSTNNDFEWSYTNPVYTEQAPEAYINNGDMSYEGKAVIAAPAIKVVKIKDKGRVNIVIEIRQ